MVKFLSGCIFKPKQLINSNKLNEYSFAKLNFFFIALFFLIACAYVNTNIYRNKEFVFMVFIVQVILQQIIILLFVYLSTILIGICASFVKDRNCKIFELNRAIFPFIATMTLIRMVLILLVQFFYIDSKFLMLVTVLVPRLYVCYPVYLVLNKYKFNKKIHISF